MAVRTASKNKCDICGIDENLTAHHLYNKSSHPTLAYAMENGVCLCDKVECTPQSYLQYKKRVHKGTKTYLQIENNYFIRLSA